MARCAAIKANGERCKGVAIGSSEWCYQHSPEYAEERKRNASKGGRRGGRGRPMAEIADLKEILATLTERVTDRVIGDEEYLSPAAGAVAAQLVNARARLIELERKIREQDDLEARIQQLEEGGALHEESA